MRPEKHDPFELHRGVITTIAVRRELLKGDHGIPPLCHMSLRNRTRGNSCSHMPGQPCYCFELPSSPVDMPSLSLDCT